MATVAVIFSHGSVQGAINPLAYWHGPIDSSHQEGSQNRLSIQPYAGGKKRLVRNELVRKRWVQEKESAREFVKERKGAKEEGIPKERVRKREAQGESLRGPGSGELGGGCREGRRGWSRLPQRPLRTKWTHTLSRHACLVSEGESAKERTKEDTFTTIVTILTTAAATYTPTPVYDRLSPWRGAPSQRNYAKSPTRKIRDTTSRRVPTCCIVISGNLRVQPARVLGVTVRSRSRISKVRRQFASLTRRRASYGKYAYHFAQNQAPIYKSYI